MVADLEKLNILGIMSGTSLDGLDMALCSFSKISSEWNYRIIKATTLPYPSDIKEALVSAINMNSTELLTMDHFYGKWIGRAALQFLSAEKAETHWIASHGHTIFHQPSKGFTLQIGNGHDIAVETGLSVIYDFRSMDVALGGQGAPLVPIGDDYLFGNFDFCLNLGGFSNISYKTGSKRIAFDICPVNMGLNHLAEKLDMEYDRDGDAGRSGKIIPDMLNQLNAFDYYHQNPPKSLGREWFLNNIEPLLNQNYDLKDIFRTFYEHIAFQITNIINGAKGKSILITGGGARNAFLVELIRLKTDRKIVIPDSELIDFKEALIFAFLGYLRIHNQVNVLSSVTGSSADHCAGVLVHGRL